jgi:four helix bundle protein
LWETSSASSKRWKTKERRISMTKKPHKNLEVWKISMELCRKVYERCVELPLEEKFGLSGQMKRAAVSIPSNIAEGAARNTKKEFIQFLSIAQGSLAELDTQLELCCNYLSLLEYKRTFELFGDIEKISKMITGLKKSLTKSAKS